MTSATQAALATPAGGLAADAVSPSTRRINSKSPAHAGHAEREDRAPHHASLHRRVARQDALGLLGGDGPKITLPKVEASVVWAPRGLDVGDAPVLRAEHAEQRLGLRRTGADFEIERLLQDTALGGPELRQLEDEILERQRFVSASRSGATRAARRRSRRTRVDFSSRSRCRPITMR